MPESDNKWFFDWHPCGEVLERFHQIEKQISLTDFFNSKHQKIREAWTLATFARLNWGPECKIKLNEGFPDGQVKLGKQQIDYEITEALDRDRKRNEEYRKLQEMEMVRVDPKYSEARDQDYIPTLLNSLVKKAEKHYSQKINLLIYSNTGKFGGHKDSILAHEDVFKPYLEFFKSINFLYSEGGFECVMIKQRHVEWRGGRF